MQLETLIREIPVGLIDLKPQVRQVIDDSSIPGLAQSIETAGQIAPVLVQSKGDRFTLIVGERRLRAVKLLGKSTVRAIVCGDEVDASGILVRQLLENLQREDLNPIDRAVGIRQLMETMSWNASQTRAKLGLDAADITRSLSLLSLPEPIRVAVASGRIPPSAGYELSKIADPVKQNELAEQLIGGRITRDALSGNLKRQKRAASQQAAVSRAVAKLPAGRSVTVTGGALTLESFIEALEETLARARQARPKGLALGTFLKVLRDQAK